MERQPQSPASRDVVRAVLETRDHRHNETHAILLALYQGLVAELVEQGSLEPKPLAERVARSEAHIAPDPHGTPARAMLDHVMAWLMSMEPGLPPAHPDRWTASTFGTLDQQPADQ
jgi:hypothetical protein